jgi:hypothetical protein
LLFFSLPLPPSPASPHSVIVGPSDTSSGWSGKNYLLGRTASPSLCPASTDPLDTLCDHVTLNVDVSSGYWDTHSGSATVSISWGSSSDNFDLYLYNPSGHLVASSARGSSTSESVSVSKPAGAYEVRVVPVNVTSSAYSGTARFSSEADPPSGGGGGGGGGSAGSGGSGGHSGGGASGGSSGSMNTGPGSAFFSGPVSPYFDRGAYDGSGRQIFVPGSGSDSAHARISYSTQTRSVPGSRTGSELTSARAEGAPSPGMVPRDAGILWALVPLGVLLLTAAGYAIFEPDHRSVAGGVAAIRRRRAEVPAGFVRHTWSSISRLMKRRHM